MRIPNADPLWIKNPFETQSSGILLARSVQSFSHILYQILFYVYVQIFVAHISMSRKCDKFSYRQCDKIFLMIRVVLGLKIIVCFRFGDPQKIGSGCRQYFFNYIFFRDVPTANWGAIRDVPLLSMI